MFFPALRVCSVCMQCVLVSAAGRCKNQAGRSSGEKSRLGGRGVGTPQADRSRLKGRYFSRTMLYNACMSCFLVQGTVLDSVFHLVTLKPYFIWRFVVKYQPEAEQNNNSWNDSSDEEEGQKAKKFSSKDSKLVTVLKDQVLGLTKENDQLRERLQVRLQIPRNKNATESTHFTHVSFLSSCQWKNAVSEQIIDSKTTI